MGHRIRFFFRTRCLNSVLYDFLARAQAESEHAVELARNHGETNLLATGNEKELAELAETLGQEIPLSIFLSQSGILPADQESGPDLGNLVGQPPENPLAPGTTKVALPPCPRCLRLAEEHFLAGRAEFNHRCRICLAVDSANQQLVFTPPGTLEVQSCPTADHDRPDPRQQHALLAKAADLLAQGRQLTIITSAGSTTASLQPPAGRHQLQVQVTDPQSLPDHWLCGDDQLLLLAAWEKPLVMLHPSDLTREKHRLPDTPLPVGLADDLCLWYLGRHLQELSVSLLFLAPQQQKQPRALIHTEHGECWLLTGHRAIMPLLVRLNRPPGHNRRAEQNGYCATTSPCSSISPATGNDATLNDAVALLAQRQPATDDQPGFPARHHQAFAGFLATTPSEAVGGRVFGISLALPAAGVALLATDGRGEQEIIIPAPTAGQPLTAAGIIAQIAELDPQAQRLITNFAHRYPDRWQALQELDQPLQVAALGDLCSLLLLLCGQQAGPDHSAPQHFLDLAARATPGRSPQLEMTREDDQPAFDHRLLCRSAMSYTLAGATPAAICRGVLESLAERLARGIWAHAEPAFSPQVALCTPLCLHPAFFQAIRRQGGKDFLLAPPPVPLASLPAIGRLLHSPAPDAQPLPATAPADKERRALIKNALDVFK
ncbi:hypothetical protein [Desulfurivibrio alkaliphilus]|uniref:Uncharacterized protein n=1 Tax=Desulfurivibrio alkaliphilus (strain DSM 19089 / UNIQEM U267 / AHT2) TaxID=589865 RepID=D6Z227_DESAT|nr:hypothetical protein [Desulfurivibrio alkaliphilus]ADH85602.1 hypothetical protein DaAHT2_0898 [Desulfurivibrio alkaliphilus AHT 2]